MSYTPENERINRLGPEPLRTSPDWIGVELEETIIEPLLMTRPVRMTVVERPGGTKLLTGLKDRGYSVIVMTKAQMTDKEFFRTVPHWKPLIRTILWDSDIQKDQHPFRKSTWMESLAESDPAAHDAMDQVLSVYMGGKYPPLFGIGAGIIDDSMMMNLNGTYRIPELKQYGFRIYDPKSLDTDPSPDAWVGRVLEMIDRFHMSDR